MINKAKLKCYELYCDRLTRQLMFGIALCVVWYLSNILVSLLLNLNNLSWEWGSIDAISYGFIFPVCLSLTICLIPAISLYYWFKGGVARYIANYSLFIWTAFILASYLALATEAAWDGLNIAPYPWLIYSIWLRASENSIVLGHLKICLAIFYSLIAIIVVAKIFNFKTRAEKIFGDAHFANAFEIEKADLYSKKGLVIGKAFGKICRVKGHEGMLVVAPTGGGKTSSIAIPNLIEWDGSGIFNDLKGELYRLTAKYRQQQLKNKCFLWAPTELNMHSHSYNPFFYVSANIKLRVHDIQIIAEALIPESTEAGGFWYTTSRNIFLLLSLYLFETKGSATLAEIHDLSKTNHFFSWVSNEIAENDEKNFSKELIQNANAILSVDERTRGNVLGDFHARVSLFNDPIICEATSKNDFDFRLMRKEKISLYIHIPEIEKERLRPLLTLFWAQFINIMASNEPANDEPYSVLALMDEFGNMSRINKLKDGVTFLRSYHVIPIVIVQHLSQIISTYGKYDAKGFINAKIKISFTLNDIDDAKHVSEILGKKTVRVRSSSTNTGHSDEQRLSRGSNSHYQSRELMTPSEIMRLAKNKSLIMIEARYPIKAKKCYWFKEPRYIQMLNKDGYEI